MTSKPTKQEEPKPKWWVALVPITLWLASLATVLVFIWLLSIGSQPRQEVTYTIEKGP